MVKEDNVFVGLMRKVKKKTRRRPSFCLLPSNGIAQTVAHVSKIDGSK